MHTEKELCTPFKGRCALLMQNAEFLLAEPVGPAPADVRGQTGMIGKFR
jgi:hypothetical protein